MENKQDFLVMKRTAKCIQYSAKSRATSERLWRAEPLRVELVRKNRQSVQPRARKAVEDNISPEGSAERITSSCACFLSAASWNTLLRPFKSSGAGEPEEVELTRLETPNAAPTAPRHCAWRAAGRNAVAMMTIG